MGGKVSDENIPTTASPVILPCNVENAVAARAGR
jgi:hypothetical protein